MRFLFLAVMLLATNAFGADTLMNIEPDQTAPAGSQAPAIAPGSTVILPDGSPALVQTILPDGNLRTDIDIVLSPAGIILSGPHKGAAVTPLPSISQPESALPEAAAQTPPKTGVVTPKPGESQKAVTKAPELAQNPAKTPKTDEKPEPPATQAAPVPDERLTIAEMLPMTTVPEKKEQQAQEPKETPKKEERQARPEKKKETIPHKQEAAPEKPLKKPEQPKKADPQKQPPKEKNQKPAPGQALKIPQEAIKTGSLDFLEGCWQGTRPEYYSKRTIKECFCFGAGGKNGKRRIIDSQNNRRCIGATQATLSKTGVLSVTSSGAACNDGERWGQAEMVCRNTGPHTPCSWLFKDAQNGQQSYQIPFVRVESCGR